MDTSTLLIIIFSACAGAVFPDILSNIPQERINQWTKDISRALNQFFEFYFYIFLPWIEVISISIAGLFCIWINAYTNPWNFALFIFSVFVVLFCSACTVVFLHQRQIGEYLTQQLMRIIKK